MRNDAAVIDRLHARFARDANAKLSSRILALVLASYSPSAALLIRSVPAVVAELRAVAVAHPEAGLGAVVVVRAAGRYGRRAVAPAEPEAPAADKGGTPGGTQARAAPPEKADHGHTERQSRWTAAAARRITTINNYVNNNPYNQSALHHSAVSVDSASTTSRFSLLLPTAPAASRSSTPTTCSAAWRRIGKEQNEFYILGYVPQESPKEAATR